MLTGSKLLSGTKVVTTAGTAVHLETSGSERAALSVIIQALYTNEGRIVIGGENVRAKEGTHGTPEQRGIGLEKGQYASFDLNDSTQIWLDTNKNGDGVAYTVLLA